MAVLQFTAVSPVTGTGSGTWICTVSGYPTPCLISMGIVGFIIFRHYVRVRVALQDAQADCYDLRREKDPSIRPRAMTPHERWNSFFSKSQAWFNGRFGKTAREESEGGAKGVSGAEIPTAEEKVAVEESDKKVESAAKVVVEASELEVESKAKLVIDASIEAKRATVCLEARNLEEGREPARLVPDFTVS